MITLHLEGENGQEGVAQSCELVQDLNKLANVF